MVIIMYRIGIVGTQSSHCINLVNMINARTDVEVGKIYGDDPAVMAEILNRGLAQSAADSIEETAADSDAVMIVLRDGSEHAKAAEICIGLKKPVFIDKPFCVESADVKAIFEMAENNGVPVTGGSYLKFAPAAEKLRCIDRQDIMSGYLSFPISMNSPYGGIHFYSHHIIELMLSIFGADCIDISSIYMENKTISTVRYKNFGVILNFGTGYGNWYAGINTAEKSIMLPLELDGCAEKQLDEFINMIKTGKSPYTQEYFENVVKIAGMLKDSCCMKGEAERNEK